MTSQNPPDCPIRHHRCRDVSGPTEGITSGFIWTAWELGHTTDNVRVDPAQIANKLHMHAELVEVVSAPTKSSILFLEEAAERPRDS